jgi:haloalkane dehalogenase
MHYLDELVAEPQAESSETLLFVHGNPTWSFHWRELIRALRGRYRCVAPDHLGCGLSDLPTRSLRMAHHVNHLAQFVETLELSNVTLVAQDWGGAIGLAAMLRFPERLQRIILLNTGAFPPPYIPWRIRVCRMPVLGRLAVQGGNLFSRAALRMALAKGRLPSDVEAGYLAPYCNWQRRQAVYDFVADIPASPSHPTWKDLEQLERNLPQLADRPIQLIWGMADWCFRPECLARFETIWPRAQIHRLAGVGHWVVEDACDEVIALINQFLGELPLPEHQNARLHA